MKTVIFLIISSQNEPIYKFMKDCFRIYAETFQRNQMHHYPTSFHFLYYFVEYTTDNFHVDNDTIYVKGEESIVPGIFLKTIKAFQFINRNLEYDIVVRTNLSSFWNLPLLFEFLQQYDEPRLATGIQMFSSFLSGTGILLSKTVAVELVQVFHAFLNQDKALLNENHDDVLLTHYLQKIATITPLPESTVLFLTHPDCILPEDVSNILYFRVKTEERLQDAILFTKLMKKMYNLHIDFDDNYGVKMFQKQ